MQCICDHSMWALYVWPLYGSTLCVATLIVTTLWEHSMCGHSMWALYVGPFYVSTLCVATLCVTTLCEHSMSDHSMWETCHFSQEMNVVEHHHSSLQVVMGAGSALMRRIFHDVIGFCWLKLAVAIFQHFKLCWPLLGEAVSFDKHIFK